MGQFKTIFLSLVMIGLLPIYAMAEDEETSSSSVGESSVNANSGMVRQTNTVKGYHPLTVAGKAIEAAYMEETLGERHGAIILLHDDGEQFESEGVITPLRHSLLEYGWSTLTLTFDYPFKASILLSNDEEEVIESEAETTPTDDKAIEDVEEDTVLPAISNQDRIQAALSFLQAKGVERILFLGHGGGGDMAIELLDTIKTPVSALILVGSTAMPKNEIFDGFNFPILDVYGTNDLAGVPAAIKHRELVMKRIDNKRYQTRRIVGADHVFLGLEPTLTATIRGWLRSEFVELADN